MFRLATRRVNALRGSYLADHVFDSSLAEQARYPVATKLENSTSSTGRCNSSNKLLAGIDRSRQRISISWMRIGGIQKKISQSLWVGSGLLSSMCIDLLTSYIYSWRKDGMIYLAW